MTESSQFSDQALLSELAGSDIRSRRALLMNAVRRPVESLEARILFTTFTVDHAVGPFFTIGAAVAAANVNPGPDFVVVHPGVYHEQGITVTDNDTRISGPKTNVDARFRSLVDPGDTDATAGGEAVLDGANSGLGFQADSPGFLVQADRVHIRGFYIRDFATTAAMPLGSGSAIYTDQLHSGYLIKNNIIKNNTRGVYFHSSGVQHSQIEFCRIESNNNTSVLGVATPAPGIGVYSDSGIKAADVEFSRFVRNENAGVIIGVVATPPVYLNRSILVHDNTSVDESNSFVQFLGVSQGRIGFNTVTLSTGLPNIGSSIYVSASKNITVNKNKITNGANSGIRISDAYGANLGINISGNTVLNRQYGIRVTGAMDGEVQITGNTIRKTNKSLTFPAGGSLGGYGILIGDAPDEISGVGAPIHNQIFNNTVNGYSFMLGSFDIFDGTVGDGSLGTGNFYHGNKIGNSNPPGLGAL
jgi:hypothetical protein